MQDKTAILAIFLLCILLIIILVSFIAVISFSYQKKQNAFQSQLERIRSNYEKELLKSQLEMQEQTFQYISQEIHDNIGQFLSLAKLHLNTLNFSNLEMTRKQVANSIDLLTRALDDLRDLSKSLSLDIIKNGGLTAAIDQQVVQLKKLEFPEIIYSIRGDYQFLDEQKEIFLLRILQEAINNIVRHAQAGKIEIILSYCDNNLSMMIRDNGKGFDMAAIRNTGSSGINNMKKRAKMMGAVCHIQSAQNSGTSISITIPY